MRQGHGKGAARITSNNVRSSVDPSPAQVLLVARGRFEAAVKLNPGHTGTFLANKTRALVWKWGSRFPHPVLKTHQRAFKRLKIMCLFPHSPNQCWTHGFAKGRAASSRRSFWYSAFWSFSNKLFRSGALLRLLFLRTPNDDRCLPTNLEWAN